MKSSHESLVSDLWQRANSLGVSHIPLATHTPNLGDDIQTEAARRWFGVSQVVPRDQPKSWPKGACVALCGWWSVNFLPPPEVRVVLIGMHLDPRCLRRLTEAHWRRVRKLVERQGFPLGCRDLATLEAVRRHGVDAVFSGCVTQTLPAAQPAERRGRYAVDCTPPDESWTPIQHRFAELRTLPAEQRLALACERLETYAQAEAVLTSRLHAFLPARALGVPSVDWKFDQPPMNPSRLSGHCEVFSLESKRTRADGADGVGHAATPAAGGPAALPEYALAPHGKETGMFLKSVLWERDQERVLAAFNGDSVSGRRLRVQHAAGLLELRDPVSASNLAEALGGHSVDLGQPLDLEFLPNEAIWHTDPGEKDTEPDLASTAILVATPAAGGPAALPSVAALCERRTFSGEGAVQGEEISGGHRPPAQPTRLPPMFFRADGGVVDLADLYPGQTLFLVLNGGSLKDFDFDRLKQPGICSMGVNNGAHGFRPQFWTCVDDPTRFLESIWRDPAILKFVPQGFFDKPIWDAEKDVLSNWRVRNFPNVLGYRRNERFQAAQWLHEDTFNWGNHADYGGGRSVMLVALRLAYLLGFRRVNLLGCDFHMDEQNRYWFDEERTPASIRSNTSSYRIMTGYFAQLKPHFDHAGFQVFNCNPNSHLKVFPFADPDAALREAEVRRSANTRGMYVDRYKAPALPKEEGREFLEPLLAAVNGAAVSTEPFVHLRLTNVFPEPVYRRLLAHLPEEGHYHELRHADAIQPDGKSARLRFTFGDKEMAALPPEQRAFWQRVLLALCDPMLEKALRDKLKAGLHDRFRDSLSEITLRPVVELIRDLPGYRIGAHTGIFKKVITTQFYLPEDDSQEPLGTVFYRKDNSGKMHSAHQMPFLPATGYALAVNAQSWHGVERLPALTQARNSLMLTYYLAKTAATAP